MLNNHMKVFNHFTDDFVKNLYEFHSPFSIGGTLNFPEFLVAKIVNRIVSMWNALTPPRMLMLLLEEVLKYPLVEYYYAFNAVALC